jgi:hypothetical protein
MTEVLAIASLVVSVVAVVASIWAVVVAKSEPTRARRRAHRDELRASLILLRDLLKSGESALGQGAPLPEGDDEMAETRAILRAVGPRLPERTTLRSIEVNLSICRSRWREVWHLQQELKTLALVINKARAEGDAQRERGLSTTVQADRDRMQEVRADCRTEVRDLLGEIDAVVSAWDSADQSGREPALI